MHADDVAAGVRAGPDGAAAWAAVHRSPTAAAVLLRLHDLVLDRADDILDLIQWESGKARKHAFEEVAHVALTRALLRRARRRGCLAPAPQPRHRSRC